MKSFRITSSLLLFVSTIFIAITILAVENTSPDYKSGQDFEKSVWKITISNGSLKSLPDPKSAEIITVSSGSKVLILGYYEDSLSQGYFKVTFNDKIGYMYKFLFDIDDNLRLQIASTQSFFVRETFKEFENLKKIQNKIQSNKGWIKPPRANIRKADSLNSDILDKLEQGSIVFVQNEIGDWRYVYYDPDIDLTAINNEKDIFDAVYRFARIDYASTYKKGWVHKITFSKSPIVKLVNQEKPDRNRPSNDSDTRIQPKPVLDRYYRCKRVIDGDTIIVQIKDDEERVRLIGIDTPETNQPDEPDDHFGETALTFTKSMVEGRKVRLEYDSPRRGKYRRLFAYVYLKDGTFLNAEIVRQGYGILDTKFPFRHLDEFREYEEEAKRTHKGLWNKNR